MVMKWRVVAILLAVTGFVLAAYGAIGCWVVLPRFASLEYDEAVRRIERIHRTLGEQSDALATICRDWGAWDDTCKFIAAPNDEFLRSTAPPQVFRDLHLNLVQFYDGQGKLVWGETRNWEDGQPCQITDLPAGGLPAHHRLVKRRSASDVASGLLRLGDRVMLVASCPIVSSTREGPVLGSVVQGRWLTDADQIHLEQLLSARCRLLPFDAKKQPADGETTTRDGLQVFFDGQREDLLSAYASLPGIDGQPALLVQVDLPRQIMAEGRDLLHDMALLVLLVGLVTYTIAWWAFEQYVLRPVQRLVQHALSVAPAKSVDLERNLAGDTGHDEAYGRGLLDIVSDGVVLTDLATAKIIDLNRTFSELAGYRREELIGRRFEEIVVARGGDRETSVQAVLRSDRREFDVIDKDGARIPVKVTGKVVTAGRRRLVVAAIHPCACATACPDWTP